MEEPDSRGRTDEKLMSNKMSFRNIRRWNKLGWDDWEGIFGSRKGLGSEPHHARFGQEGRVGSACQDSGELNPGGDGD